MSRHQLIFVDVQQAARDNPVTFQAPSQAELDELRPGDSVKVQLGNERLWVLVLTVSSDRFTGTVDTEGLRELRHGEVIHVEPRHVLDCWRSSDNHEEA